MYARRYCYISEKEKHTWLSHSNPKKEFFFFFFFFFYYGEYTRMSHYKENFFKAGIHACRSKRIKS